ncbi:MAG: JAB domain-containing protein [Candidatus Ornithomonoglobus sp.]
MAGKKSNKIIDGAEETLREMDPSKLHAGHRERMRKRFDESGFDGWSEHEVLEFMLFHARPRVNMNHIAHTIMFNSANSMSRMFELAESGALGKLNNIGSGTVDFLRHLKAFIDYYHSNVLKGKSVQMTRNNFKEVLEYIDFPIDSEDLFSICLNRRMVIKYVASVAETAGETHAAMRPDRIMKLATAVGADFVVLVHNHPSGNTEPSYDDIYMTEQIDKMLSAVGIFLVDHFIVCGDEIVSIKMTLQGETDGE